MMNQPQFFSHEYEIEPGGFFEVSRPGNFFTCLGANGHFQISFDDGPKTNAEVGLKFRTDVEFHAIKIYSMHHETIKVHVGIGRGDVTDDRRVMTGSVETQERVPIMVERPDVTISAGQSIKVADANLQRQEIVLRPIEADGALRVKGLSGASLSGVPLYEREAISMATAGEVWIYNPSSAMARICIIEMVFPL